MSGTKVGGQRAAATTRRKYGTDFYIRIGSLGGKAGNTGGFYRDSERARKAGAKGGRKSKRGPAKPKPEPIKKTGKYWDII